MDSWDRVAIAFGAAVAIVVILLAHGTYNAVLGVLAAVAAVTGIVSINHVIPRTPNLAVEYRNPLVDDQAVVWQGTGTNGAPACRLLVVVRNTGKAPAEAVEVRFDLLGASEVFNESGNQHDAELQVQYVPARYAAGTRVLNPGHEWTLAMLRWFGSAQPRDATAAWRATAKGMPERSGVVRVREVPAPTDM